MSPAADERLALCIAAAVLTLAVLTCWGQLTVV